MGEYDYFTIYDYDQFAFFRVPKVFITDPMYVGMSAEAKFLYGILLDRNFLSKANGWIDEDGHVFIIFTISEMMSIMQRSKNKIFSILNELEKIGLIERRHVGLNRPNHIYLKKFSKHNGDVDILQKDLRTSFKRTPGHPLKGLPDIPEKECNNTNINKTDMNKTDKSKNDSKTALNKTKKQHAFGRFKNVYLSDSDYENLVKEFPSQYQYWIDRLSEYMASSGKKYKNHYATICMWAGKDTKQMSINVKNYDSTEVDHL